MRYALLLYSAPGASEAADVPPESWTDYTRALREAGVLLAAEQLHYPDAATTLRLRGGERLLTDGPFMETKEHLGGLYLLEVPDLDTALDWAERMPLASYGTVELRPVREGMPWQAALAG
jgi:hypothetical protein